MLESSTYKFAKCLQKRFGVIPHVTDKRYITNSYHINVTENINAFQKILIESEFQALSTGGAISYVELPSVQDNLEVILSLIQFMYNTILYAEINTKLDYCMKCGYSKEIPIVTKDGKQFFRCPQCGNTNKQFMNIVRRTCGYLGANDFNAGRLQEISERVVHVGNGSNYELH